MTLIVATDAVDDMDTVDVGVELVFVVTVFVGIAVRDEVAVADEDAVDDGDPVDVGVPVLVAEAVAVFDVEKAVDAVTNAVAERDTLAVVVPHVLFASLLFAPKPNHGVPEPTGVTVRAVLIVLIALGEMMLVFDMDGEGDSDKVIRGDTLGDPDPEPVPYRGAARLPVQLLLAALGLQTTPAVGVTETRAETVIVLVGTIVLVDNGVRVSDRVLMTLVMETDLDTEGEGD